MTRFKTPFGSPASSSIFTSSIDIIGVSLAGFKTSVLPEIKAGITFHAGIAIGKFQGVIKPTTPIGLLTVMQNLSGSSEGVVSPSRRLPSPAA